MFHIIGFIITGIIVGLIARALKPGDNTMSLTKTAVVGMIGALFAGWVGHALGWYTPEEGAGFITSTVGAVIALFAYHAVTHSQGGNHLINH